MAKRILGLMAGMAMFLPNAAAPAQETQTPEDAQIVVQGRRTSEDDIRDLVKTLPPVSANGHISRVEMRACPGIVGVSERQKTLAVARMRAVTEAAGVRLAKPDCRVNLLVIVTNDKFRLMKHLASRYPWYYGDLSMGYMTRLAKAPAPVAIWHLQNLLDADGREVSVAGGGTVAVNRTGRRGSRITDSAHPSYAGSIMVVETRALAGLTTTQLADYAIMRMLSGADPARLPDRSARSILTVLEAPVGSEIPVTLTDWDLAFLKGLYASDPDRFASGQRGEIQAAMRKELGVAREDPPQRR